MKRRNGFVRKGLLLGGAAGLAGAFVALSILAKPASPQGTPILIFAAPSSIPLGESWVLLGSRDDLPEDLVVTALSAGASVLEVQALSKKGRAVRVQVAALAPGRLLRASSISKGFETDIDVFAGEAIPFRAVEKNILPTDFEEGILVVGREDFVYGYEPGTEGGLAALRIHNRATGAWVVHEIAAEAERALAEPAIDPGPAFVEVDPLETLPDTDGNGVPDFDETPEERTPIPLQLGVAVEPGRNILDVVAVDSVGNVSWRTIEVHSTYVAEEGGN